jgi:hypothetical protein
MKIRKLQLFIMGAIFLGLNALQISAQSSLIIKTDPRVELLSIVYYLAGAEEFNSPVAVSYKNDIDKYFGKYKDHDLIKMARESHNNYSYNVVINLAVHISDAFAPEEIIPFHPKPNSLYWDADYASEFVKLLKKFSKDTDFRKFIDSHAEFYNACDANLKDMVSKNMKFDWFDSFFGGTGNRKFILVPAYLYIGNCSIEVQDSKNNTCNTYAVVTMANLNSAGIPQINKYYIGILVHEFCHSFTTPVIDNNIEVLKNACSKIFPYVSEILSIQYYNTWYKMMMETLTNVCVQRYYLKYNSDKSLKADLANNKRCGFIWADELYKLFDEYENNRNKFPAFNDFMPKIVEFFNNYADGIETTVARLEKAKELKYQELREKGPKIVSTFPANGDTNVDPNTEYFTVLSTGK